MDATDVVDILVTRNGLEEWGTKMQRFIGDALSHDGRIYCRDCYANNPKTPNMPEGIFYEGNTYDIEDETVYCSNCSRLLSREVMVK